MNNFRPIAKPTRTHAHRRARAHAHHDPGFWRGCIFSTDHKVIGIQYGFTALCFLLFGFFLMLLMRWQIAHPGQPVPFLGPLLGKNVLRSRRRRATDAISPELYNSFGAMHGTIMVFLGVVPLAFAAFGNYVVPLMIGAPDMAFPRVNMASYQAYFLGGVVMLVSFFIPGGAAQAGWTSYSPLATTIPTHGQAFWIIGMVLLITSSLLGAVNFIATIIQLRAPGMTWMRLPWFVWAQFVTAFILLLAFPPLEAAGIMQLMDNLAAHELLSADGPGGRRQTGEHQRRRQPVVVAAFVLVPRPPGSLCFDSAGDGHRSVKSSPTTRASRSGATNRSCIRCWPSGSCRSSSGRTTCI